MILLTWLNLNYCCSNLFKILAMALIIKIVSNTFFMTSSTKMYMNCYPQGSGNLRFIPPECTIQYGRALNCGQIRYRGKLVVLCRT